MALGQREHFPRMLAQSRTAIRHTKKNGKSSPAPLRAAYRIHMWQNVAHTKEDNKAPDSGSSGRTTTPRLQRITLFRTWRHDQTTGASVALLPQAHTQNMRV